MKLSPTLILTQSSTILVIAFMTLGSLVFSINPTRIVPMKHFRMSMLITPTRFFTRSRLRINSSLATAQSINLTFNYHFENVGKTFSKQIIIPENHEKKLMIILSIPGLDSGVDGVRCSRAILCRTRINDVMSRSM